MQRLRKALAPMLKFWGRPPDIYGVRGADKLARQPTRKKVHEEDSYG